MSTSASRDRARPGSALPARDHAEMRAADHVGSPGCALCAGRSAAEKRFVDAVIAEAVTDVGARRRLDLAGGYCARHTALLPVRERERRGGTLGSAILLASVLERRLAALEAVTPTGGRRLGNRLGIRREQPSRSPACPVCQDVVGSTGAMLTVIIGRLADPAWADALARSALCVDDLATLRESVIRSGPEAMEAWRPIGVTQLARLRGILATADRYVDHSGHDRQAELTDEERTAVDVLVGALARGPG